jgi:hypothetical protein
MLEQETEQIIALLIRRTIGQDADLRLQDFLACPVPRGIKSFFRAEVAGWLTDELRQGRRLAGIVHAEPAGGGTASALVHAASLEYVFPRAEFVATLDQAVHFLGNYLCRPQWTLRQFLTPAGQPAPAGMVRQRLAYVCDYSYLPTLIGRYIERRKMTAISPAQLGSLVEQIDRLVVQRSTFAGLARMTEPMFEFFALAAPESQHIPLKPLLVFLGDKNQQMLQDHLEQLCRRRGVATLTLQDLVRSLSELDDDARIRTTLYAPPPETADAEAPGEPQEQPRTEPPVSIPPEDDAAAEVGTAPPAPPAPVTPDSRNIPLSLTFAGIESTRPALPLLEKFIQDEQRRFFIESLFQKDPAFYAGVIDALNRIPSWSEAAGYLRGLFESHGVDPLSDEALEFVEAVQLRYRNGRS